MSYLLSIYVHIPFCVRKCPYCDFNSRRTDRDDRTLYLEALGQEIRSSPPRSSESRPLFLGGGTPTELTGDEIERLIVALYETFDFQAGSEWTIECNPGTVSPATCDRLLELGFNRISLGIQSFSDPHLRTLGRIHTASESLRTYHRCRKAGFENVNVDLIFAIPGQSHEDWVRDLRKAINLAPEHLSLYNLTVEKGTRFGRLQETGRLQLASEDLQAEMFETAMQLTAKAGYGQYEVSNYALPGYECEHNLSYWTNSNYLGFGISASSYVNGLRWTNTGKWNDYLLGAARGEVPREVEERLGPVEAAGEEIMLRLRTQHGVSLTQLSEKYKQDFATRFAGSISFLLEEGLLIQDNGFLRLSQRGKLLANSVCAEFLGAE